MDTATLALWVNIATLISVLIAALALIASAIQISQNTKTQSRSNTSQRASFWIELRQLFLENHWNIHVKLRSGESLINEDWPRIEAYIGSFQQCANMLYDQLIDWPTFQDIYGYRVANIAFHPGIFKSKLVDHADDYDSFIYLMVRLSESDKKYEDLKELVKEIREVHPKAGTMSSRQHKV